MKIVHYDYTLECTHHVGTNIAKGSQAKPYHENDFVICPKCQYRQKKIVQEKTSEADIG